MRFIPFVAQGVGWKPRPRALAGSFLSASPDAAPSPGNVLRYARAADPHPLAAFNLRINSAPVAHGSRGFFNTAPAGLAAA